MTKTTIPSPRSLTGGRGRRPARLFAGAAAVLMTILGLVLATAGPAAAADFPGRWRSYTTSPITGPSTWKCSQTQAFDTGVLAQFCVIRSADRQSVQAAMIVRNNRTTLYGAQVAMTIQDSDYVYGRWVCARSGVAPGTWSVCFGDTFTHPSLIGTYQGGVNGQPIGESLPDVWV